jgi:hypothetical protein
VADSTSELVRIRTGCGVNACLTIAVLLFAVLLVAVLAIAMMRPWSGPMGGP